MKNKATESIKYMAEEKKTSRMYSRPSEDKASIREQGPKQPISISSPLSNQEEQASKIPKPISDTHWGQESHAICEYEVCTCRAAQS